MKLSAALLPGDWYWIAHGVLAAVAAWVFRTAPWARLRDNAQNHLFLGSVVSLLVLWSIRPPLLRGIEFHFLGATALTLMFGPQLAIAALGLVVAGLALAGHTEWTAYSINVLVLAVLPTLVSRGVHVVSDRVLPQNIFVFIFVPAFLGGAIALALSGGAAVSLVAAFGDPLTAGMAEQFLPYCLLLSFAEATLTGMVITLMVVYRPTWVGTFDDGRYLRKQ
ncbi:MAG: energy-coupling factor ABC transporter permease [Betaproteobacteria bacterium]|nr:energy-coupling factor ABC transporter permease [Betaproteobacteria bacterium]